MTGSIMHWPMLMLYKVRTSGDRWSAHPEPLAHLADALALSDIKGKGEILSIRKRLFFLKSAGTHLDSNKLAIFDLMLPQAIASKFGGFKKSKWPL
jgi:hypothetical protein